MLWGEDRSSRSSLIKCDPWYETQNAGDEKLRIQRLNAASECSESAAGVGKSQQYLLKSSFWSERVLIIIFALSEEG